MATRPDSAEPAVDELKRRARRRLVGAVVLALAAAVILPMLFESDPKPFGDDVAIKIPPIDDGKFVNPLSPEKSSESKAAGAAGKGPTPAPGQTSDAGYAQRRPLERNPGSATSSGAAPSTAGSVADAGAPAKAPPAPTPPTAASGDTGAGLVVQVGAFADSQAADDLAAKLKNSGFAAYTEATSGEPRVQRVRIGPFGSREAAEAVLAKVKAAGYSSAIISGK